MIVREVLRAAALVVFGATTVALGIIAAGAGGSSGMIGHEAHAADRETVPPGIQTASEPSSAPTVGPIAALQRGAAPAGAFPAGSSDGRIYPAELRVLLEEHAPQYARELEEIGRCESGAWDPETNSWYVLVNAVGDEGQSLGWLQLWSGWPETLGMELDPLDPIEAIHLSVAIREARGRFGGVGGWTCADLVGID